MDAVVGCVGGADGDALDGGAEVWEMGRERSDGACGCDAATGAATTAGRGGMGTLPELEGFGMAEVSAWTGVGTASEAPANDATVAVAASTAVSADPLCC